MAWLARSLLLAIACAAAGFVIVALAGAAGLRAAGQDPIDLGEYVFTLALSALWVWPLYMLALYAVGRRGRFRLWALVLCPLLVAGMSIANLAIQVPEVQATDLACVLFALTVRRRVPRRDGTWAQPQVETPASWRPRPRTIACPARCATSGDRRQRSTWAMLLVVAAIVGALVASGLGGAIADRAGQAICAIAGQGCATPASASTGEDALRERLTALEPLVNSAGGALGDLAAQAQAAIDRGDLDEARRLIEQLEFYRDLFESGPRGETLAALVSPSAAEFAALVEQGTIQADDDDTNRRYFQLPPAPGQGILVMDLFIPDENAGPLKGDGRGFENPLRNPDLEETDSRVMVIIDRETGRGVIVQSQSCTVSVAGAGFCNEARPISINGDLGLIENDSENDVTGEGINLDVTNNYNISADGDGVHLDYESRNSVSPVAGHQRRRHVPAGRGRRPFDHP